MGVIMMSSGEEDVISSSAQFVTFNQDTTCVAVGTNNGYSLYSINSTDSMDLVHKDDDPDIYIAERLFSSSLVATVSNANPRTLQVCHFKKGTEICRYSYNDRIRAVRMNRSRLVVCLEESLYSLDMEEGGDCSLIKQFSLADTDSDTDSLSDSLQQLQTDHHPSSGISFDFS